MALIQTYYLPREVSSYLRTVLPEPRNIYYVKYIVDKVGLFAPSKGRTFEWQLTNPTGGLLLWDILRQGRSLILSTISTPVGGLVRFNLKRKDAFIFTPDPDVLSLWSYSIAQDERRRIWSTATGRFSPLDPKAPPQDNPTLARTQLNPNSGVTDFWVLPSELSAPYMLQYDKLGRLWFSLTLSGTGGRHQFGMFDPGKNVVVGYTIQGIGTMGISDIAVDSANDTVWLTHRQPNAVFRFDWNSKEATAYENPSMVGPDHNDLGPKGVPYFLSRDGRINTVDAHRATDVYDVKSTKYKVIPQHTELHKHALGVARSTAPVSTTSQTEPETYAGPFIRWPVPALTGLPSPADVKCLGNKAYFTEAGDSLLCVMKV